MNICQYVNGVAEGVYRDWSRDEVSVPGQHLGGHQ